MVNQNTTRSRSDLSKCKDSHTEVCRSGSSICHKENKNLSCSRSRLSAKSSLGGFTNERKDRGSSNVSISSKKKSSHRGIVTKNQYCQTIDPRKCDQLFHDGVIKYPSAKIQQELAEIERQKQNRLDIHVKKEFYKRNKIKIKSSNKSYYSQKISKISEKGDEGDAHASETEEEEQVEQESENKSEVTDRESKSKSPSPVPPPPPPSQPTTMRAAEIIRQTTENINSPRKLTHSDHVPSSKGDCKVIKKEPNSREEEILKKNVFDPHCPPGHIPLPDGERKKTLHMLRVSHAELVREMNLLPVRTDTLRIRQKKMQLESQLNKIEEGIKVFNKSRVYVKIEE